MEFFESLINFFADYGWPGIFAIGLICALFFGSKYFDKKADNRSNKMTHDLSENIINAFTQIEKHRMEHDRHVELELIDTIKSTINNHYTNQQTEHLESENHRFNMTGDVSSKLWDMMNKYNSQRAMIIEIHNGGVNLNRLSFLRYDVTYEKQVKGVFPINNEIQNLPASNLEIVTKDIVDSEHNVVIYRKEDIDKLYDRGATVLWSDLTQKLHAENVIYSGIYNDDNILYAIICLEYHEGYPYPENVIDEIEIAKSTSEISQLYKYVKKY